MTVWDGVKIGLGLIGAVIIVNAVVVVIGGVVYLIADSSDTRTPQRRVQDADDETRMRWTKMHRNLELAKEVREMHSVIDVPFRKA